MHVGVFFFSFQWFATRCLMKIQTSRKTVIRPDRTRRTLRSPYSFQPFLFSLNIHSARKSNLRQLETFTQRFWLQDESDVDVDDCSASTSSLDTSSAEQPPWQFFLICVSFEEKPVDLYGWIHWQLTFFSGKKRSLVSMSMWVTSSCHLLHANFLIIIILSILMIFAATVFWPSICTTSCRSQSESTLYCEHFCSH